jgi:hypothetical protein
VDTDAPPVDEAVPPNKRWLSSPTARRSLLIFAILTIGAICYAFVVDQFNIAEEPSEQQFGVALDKADIALYLHFISIDPYNETMQVRISVLPSRTGDAAPVTVADRDLMLMIRRGDYTEQVRIVAKHPFPDLSHDLDLDDGSIRDYPLDEYESIIIFESFEVNKDNKGEPLLLHVTTWEGILGYNVRAQEIAASSHQVQLRFNVRRTRAATFFGLVTYGMMIVLAGCALIIGSLVFIGVRRIEVTLAGALGAIVFSLPTLRHALPGSPPLGVRADVLVFFWAELSVVFALCLFIGAWMRRGSSP